VADAYGEEKPRFTMKYNIIEENIKGNKKGE